MISDVYYLHNPYRCKRTGRFDFKPGGRNEISPEAKASVVAGAKAPNGEKPLDDYDDYDKFDEDYYKKIAQKESADKNKPLKKSSMLSTVAKVGLLGAAGLAAIMVVKNNERVLEPVLRVAGLPVVQDLPEEVLEQAVPGKVVEQHLNIDMENNPPKYFEWVKKCKGYAYITRLSAGGRLLTPKIIDARIHGLRAVKPADVHHLVAALAAKERNLLVKGDPTAVLEGSSGAATVIDSTLRGTISDQEYDNFINTIRKATGRQVASSDDVTPEGVRNAQMLRILNNAHYASKRRASEISPVNFISGRLNVLRRSLLTGDHITAVGDIAHTRGVLREYIIKAADRYNVPEESMSGMVALAQSLDAHLEEYGKQIEASAKAEHFTPQTALKHLLTLAGDESSLPGAYSGGLQLYKPKAAVAAFAQEALGMGVASERLHGFVVDCLEVQGKRDAYSTYDHRLAYVIKRKTDAGSAVADTGWLVYLPPTSEHSAGFFGGTLSQAQAVSIAAAVVQERVTRNQLAAWLSESEDDFYIRGLNNLLHKDGKPVKIVPDNYYTVGGAVADSTLVLRGKEIPTNESLRSAARTLATRPPSKNVTSLQGLSVALGPAEVQIDDLLFDLSDAEHIRVYANNIHTHNIPRNTIGDARDVIPRVYLLVKNYLDTQEGRMADLKQHGSRVSEVFKELQESGAVSAAGEVDARLFINTVADKIPESDKATYGGTVVNGRVARMRASTAQSMHTLVSRLNTFASRPEAIDCLQIEYVPATPSLGNGTISYCTATSRPGHIDNAHYDKLRFIVRDAEGAVVPATPDQVERGLKLLSTSLTDGGKLKGYSEVSEVQKREGIVANFVKSGLSDAEITELIRRDAVISSTRNATDTETDTTSVDALTDQLHRQSLLTKIVPPKSASWQASIGSNMTHTTEVLDASVGPFSMANVLAADGERTYVYFDGIPIAELSDVASEDTLKVIKNRLAAIERGYANTPDTKVIELFKTASLEVLYETDPGLKALPSLKSVLDHLTGNAYSTVTEADGGVSEDAVRVALLRRQINDLLIDYMHYVQTLAVHVNVPRINLHNVEDSSLETVPIFAAPFYTSTDNHIVFPIVNVSNVEVYKTNVNDKRGAYPNGITAITALYDSMNSKDFLKFRQERRKAMKANKAISLTEEASAYYFFNPYHCPETGRFTFKPGGTGADAAKEPRGADKKPILKSRRSKAVSPQGKRKSVAKGIAASYYRTPYGLGTPGFEFYTGSVAKPVTFAQEAARDFAREHRDDYYANKKQLSMRKAAFIVGKALLAAGGVYLAATVAYRQMLETPHTTRGSHGIGRIPVDRASIPAAAIFSVGTPAQGQIPDIYKIDLDNPVVRKQYEVFGGEQAVGGSAKVLSEDQANAKVSLRSDHKDILIPIASTTIPAVLRTLPIGHVHDIHEIRIGNPEDDEMWDAPKIKDAFSSPKKWLHENKIKAVFREKSEESELPKGYTSPDVVYSADNKTLYIHDRPYDTFSLDEDVVGFRSAILANDAVAVASHLDRIMEKRGAIWHAKAEQVRDAFRQSAAGKKISDSEDREEKAQQKVDEYLRKQQSDLILELTTFSLDSKGAVQATLRGIGQHVARKLTPAQNINLYQLYRDTQKHDIPTVLAYQDVRHFFAEGYTLYVTRPSLLESTHPRLYAFIRDNVFFGVEYKQRSMAQDMTAVLKVSSLGDAIIGKLPAHTQKVLQNYKDMLIEQNKKNKQDGKPKNPQPPDLGV